MLKRCTNCGQEKDEAMFHKNAQGRRGLDPACKHCKCEKAKAWNRANSDRVRATKANYYKNNLRQIGAYHRVRNAKLKEQFNFYKELLRFEKYTLEELEEFVRWRAMTPEQRQEKYKNARRRHVLEVTDNYLRNHLSQRIGVPRDEIPDKFLAAKRAHILTKRLLRSKQHEING